MRFFLLDIHDSKVNRWRERPILSPFYHFYPLHKRLDISQATVAESSPKKLANDQTGTWNFSFPSACPWHEFSLKIQILLFYLLKNAWNSVSFQKKTNEQIRKRKLKLILGRKITHLPHLNHNKFFLPTCYYLASRTVSENSNKFKEMLKRWVWVQKNPIYHILGIIRNLLIIQNSHFLSPFNASYQLKFWKLIYRTNLKERSKVPCRA